jgi:hypothetical protein
MGMMKNLRKNLKSITLQEAFQAAMEVKGWMDIAKASQKGKEGKGRPQEGRQGR